MFEGSTVALITPMSADGDIDFEQLAGLIDFHIDAGTEALVIAGTTGESATLTKPEHVDLIARSCELAGSRIPIPGGSVYNVPSRVGVAFLDPRPVDEADFRSEAFRDAVRDEIAERLRELEPATRMRV